MAIGDGPVIVGGGPAGLAAAIELRSLEITPVTVIERERDAGGIPRHSDHTGFGLRDLRTVLTGPRYAERYRELAAYAGVDVVTETMVTDWGEDRQLKLTGPGGRTTIEPPAVVLATGCRERPRSARLVPGDRPAGVMTTSTLQQLVHLRGERVGRRAVIVGAEHVSFSAVATLAHAGASVAGLATELPRHQTLAAFRVGAAARYRAPVWTRTGVDEHPWRRAGGGGGAHRPRLRTHPGCPVRPGGLHRRLDPGSRARRDGRLRARSGLARPASGSRASHDDAGGVRGREPAASGGDRRRLCPRRPPRRRPDRRVPAQRRPVAGGGPRRRAGPARLGCAQPCRRQPQPSPRAVPAPLARDPPPAPGSR